MKRLKYLNPKVIKQEARRNKMATTKHSKKNIVLDEDFKILRREKNYKYSYCQRQFALQGSNLQCAKEKQLLQQWKKDRAMEKKARTILRKYAVYEKYDKDRNDDDVEDGASESNAIQWAHKGCNEVCKADKCIWWLLESGLC